MEKTHKLQKVKAVALLSGGLDSTLAILILLKQKVDITAITFITNFGCDIKEISSCSRDSSLIAKNFGFKVKFCHLGDKFIDIVKNPKFGYGKNMNPCIDCRILMLKEAKVFMELIGADFLVTGEVIGQRPMSQRKECFTIIDKEAGVEGLVVRPLSAKLLPPTMPEIKGLIDREKLYKFKGRTRKPQMRLAKEIGLTDYPSPAGGCLLTDPIYSYKLKDLLKHNPNPSIKELNLLKVGRHFRLSPMCKIIVGRNEQENKIILNYATDKDILIEVPEVGSPITIITGKCNDKEIKIASSITARYSDVRDMKNVKVKIFNLHTHGYEIIVNPASNKIINLYKIYNK